MKKDCWIYVLFIGVLGMALYGIFDARKKMEDKIWKLNSILLENKFALSDLRDKRLCELNSEGVLLPDSVRDYIPQNACVMRLHNGICLSCYAENLSRLVERVAERDSLELFIVGSYTFEAALKEELDVIGGHNLEYINSPFLKIMPADDIGQPYLFILNEKGMVSSLYFFQKEDFESTECYLQSLLRKKNKRSDEVRGKG